MVADMNSHYLTANQVRVKMQIQYLYVICLKISYSIE